MRDRFFLLGAIWILASAASAQEPADKREAEIAAALEQVSAKLAADPARDELRQALGRSLSEQIAAANRRSSEHWSKIANREDWEQFRDEKIKALRESLGTLPERPRTPKLLVTRELPGDGFAIHNVVYQSRPGLVVTANLYVPVPPRQSMPGILLSHSHHNPKHEGELQDMGMTWARAGCCVLVPDHLGHGERRQHPFATAADYAGPFPVSRQDYNFRYDTSLQLYLVGESLMGWMVHDLMTGVDVLLAQPGIDPKRIILLGAVAGGGDPAGVTAALDKRIACVVPFNFGGPQPENRYPLPDDAETSFNYAGSGSWESTRNLWNSAAAGFLPWVIVGSIAPRKLIHAHEFSWDRERDPVWKRYEKIWDFYNASDGLAFAHGHGTIHTNEPPGSHCNNIGTVHRRQIHEAFRQWFAIDVKSDDEYQNRKSREELTCLTDTARKEFQPKPLHEILSEMADKQLAAVREAKATVKPEERRKLARESWTRLLGDTEPPAEIKVRENSRQVEKLGPVTITRELLETDPGMVTAVLTLSRGQYDGRKQRWRPVILGFASDGFAAILKRRQDELIAAMKTEVLIVLIDVRGIGTIGPRDDRGQQSAIAAHSATALMLGQPLLGGQLRDLRTVWRHVQRREDADIDPLMIIGGTGVTPLAADAAFAYPRRIDGRPRECEPTGSLLALLLDLYDGKTGGAIGRLGLVSYRSILDSPFVQVPHESIIPGVLREGDLPDLVAALTPREVQLTGPVDGRGRLVSVASAEMAYEVAKRAYAEARAPERLQISEFEPDPPQKP